MRILVAGWQGQVSLALTEAAATRSNISAYAVGRPALELTDRPSIGRGLFGIAPDVIINTAAYSDVEGAESDPETAFQRNSHGSAALAAQAARAGIPIIHLSSVYVFNGGKSAPYVEDDTVAPINAYGRSKAAAEVAVANANPHHIILRTGWIYSPFGPNFITSMLKRGASETSIKVDQKQRGSPTYAPNLANAVLDIATQITADRTVGNWGTFHVADHAFASWHELAVEAFQYATASGRISPTIVPTTERSPSNRALRPQNAMLDCGKLEKTFGIRLPEWHTALSDCVTRICSASE